MTEQASNERTYSEEEIKARLAKDLPHWWFEGGWIRRKYKTNSWKGTLMVINTVGHLAEAAWHHPDITASYAWVEVRLQNHAAIPGRPRGPAGGAAAATSAGRRRRAS